MVTKDKKARNPKYTIRKAGAELNGSTYEMTLKSDVSSEPFPFSEENRIFFEQQEFTSTERNEP